MPKPRHIDPPVEFCVSMPKSVYDALQAKLHSEILGKVPSGQRSKVITHLVRNWLIQGELQ
jgi:hypothetical protein